MIAELSSANSGRLAVIGANRLVRLLGDWSDEGGTLHEQLAAGIRHLAASGAIASGARMPSERALGSALGISRNTVAKAFDQLRSEGVFTSRQGDGTYVTIGRRRLSPAGDDRLGSFVVIPQEKEGTKQHIDLRSAALPGLPMVADAFNNLDGSRARELVATHGYVPSGLQELRAAVADYYSGLGLPTGPEHILITSGAQQGLRLVASSFAERGAPVIIEEPSFRGAIDSLKAIGAQLVNVPSGPDGIDVDELIKAIERFRPALIVVQSTVHNPTGSITETFRRSRIAAIADRYELPIIDDATLADTVLDGDRRPLPLAAGSRRIITIGSVSKSFWGGLRVGWIRAHPNIIERLAAMKGSEDLGTSLVAQLLASKLLPLIERARDQRHEVLFEARRAALQFLREELPEWSPQIPSGGASLWIRLPAPVGSAFAQRSARAGVQILPGPTFSGRDALEDHIRLSYSGPIDDTLRGILLLSRTWREFSAG